jgi:hypothetical protein
MVWLLGEAMFDRLEQYGWLYFRSTDIDRSTEYIDNTRFPTKLGSLVGSRQGAVIVEKDHFTLSGSAACLKDAIDGQLGKSHPVIKFLRYSL